MAGTTSSEAAEYVQSTGCHHIQEALAANEAAGFKTEDFSPQVIQTVVEVMHSASSVDAEAAPVPSKP